MGFPVARLLDNHVCPMVTGVVPHVGGPISGPGVPTVLAANMPVSVASDIIICTGPPDASTPGTCSPTVMAMNKPVTKVTGVTAHGGVVVGPGAVTVLVP